MNVVIGGALRRAAPSFASSRSHEEERTSLIIRGAGGAVYLQLRASRSASRVCDSHNNSFHVSSASSSPPGHDQYSPEDMMLLLVRDQVSSPPLDESDIDLVSHS